MTDHGIMLIIRGLLLCLSFAGLCAGLRAWLKLDRFVAPFTAVSLVIALLMLGGMTGILEPVFWVLYAGGFAGLIYACAIRKIRPEYALFALMLGFVALLTLRYYDCKFFRNDELSHWALVARHLLRYDAFPNGAADYVYFQSYPLGAASLIYYVGKATANLEYLYLVAQNFLLGALFLPVLSLAGNEKSAKRVCYPFAAAMFILLFNTSRILQSLQVDLHLGFFGIGVSATVLRYRSDWKKALVAVAPALVAVVYLKNSGMFFAVLGALGIAKIACQGGLSRKRSVLLGAGLALGSVGFYGLWSLHTKLAYPAAAATKHAISLSTYSRQMQEKGLGTILAIGKRVLRELFRFSGAQTLIAAALLVMALTLILLLRKTPQLKPGLCAYGFNVGIYFLWVVLVFLMYIFSMPTEEALSTACFYRYSGTGLALLAGSCTALLVDRIGRSGTHIATAWLGRLSCAAVALFFLVAALFYGGNMQINRVENLVEIFSRNTRYIPIRQNLMNAAEQNALPQGGRILIYSRNQLGLSLYNLYVVKYELESGDLHMIGEYTEADATHKYRVGNVWVYEDTDDYAAYLAGILPSCDGVVMMNPSKEFESALAECRAQLGLELPLVYAYE